MGVYTGRYPLILWDTPADVNAWANAGTPVVTTGVADVVGGTDAVTLEDNDGAAAEGKDQDANQAAFSTIVESAVQNFFPVFMKQGTATESTYRLVIASSEIGRVDVQWPTTLDNVTGTAHRIAVGTGGWNLVILHPDQTLAAYTGATSGQLFGHQLRGATQTPTSDTGTTSWFIRNTLVMNPLHEAVAWTEPSAGQQVTMSRVSQDAWVQTTNYFLEGVFRNIPMRSKFTPNFQSPWYGGNQMTGMNPGVEDWLTWARANKSSFSWMPDREADRVETVYLESVEVLPSSASDFTRNLRVRFRNASGPFLGY